MKNILTTSCLITIFMVPLLTYGMNTETAFVPTQKTYDLFQFDDLSIIDNEQLVNKAYSMAPSEIHDMVHACKTNLPSDAYMRPLLFTGPPGTGKTTLARTLPIILNKPLKDILAIEGYTKEQIEQKCNAYRECSNRFYYKYINGSTLGDKYQHSKPQQLTKIVFGMLQTEKHCVFVIDEVHALFSGQKNENSSQAQETALALKQIFEELKESKRVLAIFTTNYPKQIPTNYGLRSWFLQGNVFHFDLPDRDKQLIALQYHLKKIPNLPNNLPENDLKQLLSKIDGWSFRRIAALYNKAAQYAFVETYEKPTLHIKHLQQALLALKGQYKLLELNQEKPSEQERFCNENLSLQYQLHNRQLNEQIRFCNDDLTLQEQFHNSQLTLSQSTMEFSNNLHNVQMVMQLRALNTARHNTSRSVLYCNNGAWGPNLGPHNGWCDYRSYGDSARALPTDVKLAVDTKKPIESLYMIDKKHIEEEKKREQELKQKEKLAREQQEREKCAIF